MNAKLYEGTTGFVLDVEIDGVASLVGIANAKLFVIPPRSSDEEEWPVTVVVEDKLLRHVVPASAPVVRGTYRIQPYFELDGFKGRWGAITLVVHKEQT